MKFEASFTISVTLLLNRYGGKVILHGLGSTIEKTCDLALQIQKELGGAAGIQLTIRTETVPLIDDFEPLDQVCTCFIFHFFEHELFY